MRYFFFWGAMLMILAVNLQNVWIFPDLTDLREVEYTVLAGAFMVGYIILDKLEEIKRGMAEGQKAEGLRSKGRSASSTAITAGGNPETTSSDRVRISNNKLYGHWHKGRWNPYYGTGENRQWQETFEDPNCAYVRHRVPEHCPDRSPRSTF
jgi:hypothetical protein